MTSVINVEVNLLQEELNEFEKWRVNKSFRFPAKLHMANQASSVSRDVDSWNHVWRYVIEICKNIPRFKNGNVNGKLPQIAEKLLTSDGFSSSSIGAITTLSAEHQGQIAQTLNFCKSGMCEFRLVSKNCIKKGDELLSFLNDCAIPMRINAGESALRIALEKDLIPGYDDWYVVAVEALKAELSNSTSRQITSVLQTRRNIVKIIWFRIAFEESRGRDYLSILSNRLEIQLSQAQCRTLMEQDPFPFNNNYDFRKYVWCLRFEKDQNGRVNGIDSFTALALRVINELDACDIDRIYEANLFGRNESEYRHLQALLGVDNAEKRDFLEFFSVFKKGICRDQPVWIDTLYRAVRRVIVGIKKQEAREAGRPEQLPEISLDFNGDLVLQTPSQTSYEDGTYCNGDKFLFYRSIDKMLCVHWEFINGVFKRVENDRFPIKLPCEVMQKDYKYNDKGDNILLKKLHNVEFCKNGNNDTNEILKYLITDDESGIGVYHVCRSNTANCGYSLVDRQPILYKGENSQKLHEGELYKVVSIKDDNVSVIAYSAKNPEGIVVPQFACETFSFKNVFKVPRGTLKLQVGQLVFDIADSRIDKLDHNPNSRISCVRNERGGPAGYRFFYNRNVYPLCDIRHVKGLWYEFDGHRYQLPIINAPMNGWNVSDDLLWHSKGRLILETDDCPGERAFPVTFVDVDFSEVEISSFAYNERRKVCLRTGDVKHEVNIAPNDAEVSIKHRGILFCPRINREGVQLCLRGKVISLTNGPNPEVEVSYDDINDDSTMLHIQSANAEDLKFFYRDVPYTKDIQLRQDGTVLFRQLLDVSSIKDLLPVKCMISPLSGIGAYSFVIYDSKSAVLEVAHGNYEKRVVVDRIAGSDDLHIKYFSSYRHHVTTNKIELAYLLSHRQDDEPKYFPLEGRMIADDPQGKGRCVESVVAKDFFKQNIEWGTGVLGFVVERSQFGVNAQTTGFFIGAPNSVPVSLDGDILKELRLALSERQVRQDLDMSDEDRQRLKRIEDEFMTDDLQKQDALREYISNAADVANQMNALDSINSFCNSIRNRRGELVWVSGFIFMAGWFVKDFIDQNGSFSMNWPFPVYWDPLLVAYKYKNPGKPWPEESVRQAKALVIGLISNLMYNQGQCWYVKDKDEDEAAKNEQLLVRIKRMVNVISGNTAVPLGVGAFADNVNNKVQCVFNTRGIGTVEHSFEYYKFFNALDVLGTALHRWRMNPTLNEPIFEENSSLKMTLNSLREYLLLIADIDSQILKSPLCHDLVNNKSAELFYNDK